MNRIWDNYRIRERAGIPIFSNPFRNLRLSAANDVCRGGFTMKVVTEWFGHDMATALEHDHQVMPADFACAREQDPVKPAEIVTPKATPAITSFLKSLPSGQPYLPKYVQKCLP